MGEVMDTLESFANASIGILVSWAATFYAMPWLFGIAPSAGQSAGIVALFFCISFIRARLLRAIFRRLA
jgi:hypothetical protein